MSSFSNKYWDDIGEFIVSVWILCVFCVSVVEYFQLESGICFIWFLCFSWVVLMEVLRLAVLTLPTHVHLRSRNFNIFFSFIQKPSLVKGNFSSYWSSIFLWQLMLCVGKTLMPFYIWSSVNLFAFMALEKLIRPLR